MKHKFTSIITVLAGFIALCSGTISAGQSAKKPTLLQSMRALSIPASATALLYHSADLAYTSYKVAKHTAQKRAAIAEKDAKFIASLRPEDGALLTEDLRLYIAEFIPQTTYREEYELKQALSIEGQVIALNQNLIAFTKNNAITLWNIKANKVQTLDGHSTQITHLIKLNETTLVSADATTLKVWNINTGVCLRTITELFAPSEDQYARNIIIALPNDKIAIGQPTNHGVTIIDILRDSAPIICDTRNGNYVDPETGMLLDSAVHCLAPLADNRLAVATQSGSIKIYDINTGAAIKTLGFNADPSPMNPLYNHLLIALPNNRLVSAKNGWLTLWDTQSESGETTHPHPLEGAAPTSILPLSSNQLALVYYDRIIIWDIATNHALQTFLRNGIHIISAIPLQHNKLALVCSDGYLGIWNFQTGNCLLHPKKFASDNYYSYRKLLALPCDGFIFLQDILLPEGALSDDPNIQLGHRLSIWKSKPTITLGWNHS